MDKSGKLCRSQTSTGSSSESNPTDGDMSDNDDPYSSDSETESNSSFDSGNMSPDSTTSAGVSAILRVMSDSLLRTELAEMEMIKTREAARWEAEKRRLEMEVELTRMVLQTHMQATASLVVGNQKISPAGRGRKRKRSEVEEHESSTTRAKSLALLGLLQLNLIFWNSLT